METLSPLPEWVSLEHEVQQILTNQEIHGWRFNEQAAWKLASTLRAELRETEETLLRRHPYVAGAEFNPKRNNRTSGYVKGAPFTKLKDTNCSSRDHIAWILQQYYGWTATTVTTTGKPVIDEVVLKDLQETIPISTMFLRILTITKMLGMISEGANAWLKLVTNDRIHHHCSVATITHRCAHRNPNLAQVPSDPRFRELFIPSPGMVMCGADLSGIELRMLSHYLCRWSDYFRDELLHGDIHQANADKIGITRKLVKTVTYAFLYGAGDEKIGLSYDKLLSSSAAKRKGKEIRAAFVDAIPGLAELLEAIKKASEKGFVRSIDGRKINVDSPHKALNMLLQSGAGVVAKRWMVINQDHIKQLNLCCSQLAFVHDELQFEVDPTHAKDLCSSLVLSAKEAGEYYNLRVEIDAEATQGNNWSETH